MHRVVFDVARKRKDTRVVARIPAGKKQVVVPGTRPNQGYGKRTQGKAED